MSKKWISILAAAVAGVLIFTPATALATCQAQVLGNLSIHDKTSGKVIADPAAPTPGDAVDGITNGTVAPVVPNINGEGQAERVADLLIYDATGVAGPTFCLNAGNVITVTFNGILTNPAVGTSLSQVNNMDAYDTAGLGGLSVTSATVGTAFSANTTQTIITITIGQGGTTGGVIYGGPASVPPAGVVAAAGSALRIKNLRIDANSIVSSSTPPVVTVTVNQGPNAGAVNGPGVPLNSVATRLATIGATTPLIAVATPTCAAGTAGCGVQSSAAGLGAPQVFNFTPGFAGLPLGTAGNTVGSPSAFRVATAGCTGGAVTCASQVENDITTGATSLAFALSGIPSGVTVTFPSKLDTSAAYPGAAPTAAITWTSRPGSTLTNAGAPGSLAVIYDTTKNNGGVGVEQIETADNADPGTAGAVGGAPAGNTNPNCKTSSTTGLLTNLNAGSNCNAFPKVGVLVGATSGAGTATINLAFGPSDTSLFTGDDAATTGLIPRYTGSGSSNGSLVPVTYGRYILKAKTYFVINPTRSTLLFPFVSTVGGFNSGISIINSCADFISTTNLVYPGAATNTCTQVGGVTLFFFGTDPTTGNAVATSINSDLTAGGVNLSSACRGFNTNGQVAPGKDIACSVAALLPLLTGAPKGFDGYVIAVTGFNNGHGFSAQFNAAGSPFGANPALVMVNAGRPSGFESLGN